MTRFADLTSISPPTRPDKKLRVKVPKKTVRDWLEPDEVITLLEAVERVDNPPKNAFSRQK
jgi:hypothetical protein